MVRPLDTTGYSLVRGGNAIFVGNVPLFVSQFFRRPVAVKSMHIDDIISVYRQIDISYGYKRSHLIVIKVAISHRYFYNCGETI